MHRCSPDVECSHVICLFDMGCPSSWLSSSMRSLHNWRCQRCNKATCIDAARLLNIHVLFVWSGAQTIWPSCIPTWRFIQLSQNMWRCTTQNWSILHTVRALLIWNHLCLEIADFIEEFPCLVLKFFVILIAFDWKPHTANIFHVIFTVLNVGSLK